MSRIGKDAAADSLIDEKSLVAGVDALIAVDADLASIVERHGYPPLWKREPGFGTLVHIILEQQVSLLSALATFRRLSALVDPLTPLAVLALDPAGLRGIGFSRQKIDYTRGLAAAIMKGRIDLDALEAMSDDEARKELMKLKGISRWSADIYLLMALGRPDIWPEGDLALEIAAAQLWQLPSRPGRGELSRLSGRWRPFRAVAARLLWHEYLSRREARAGKSSDID